MSSTVSLRITLRYKDLDEFGARYAENISSAGLFLRTRTPKPTGTRIRFELLLADGARAFFGEGVVVSVRHDDKAGMGIRYHSLDPDSQQVMEKIVAQHGEGPLAPTPLGIPAKQAGSSVWKPGAAPQWGAAQPARPSAPPSSGGLLPRDGWGRPRTPPKSEAPPPAKEVRRRSATLRPWERTGSETAQAPKAAEPDDLSRALLLPEWDDLARTTIVGAESPAGLARPADQHTVRLSVPDALSGAIASAGGFSPPTTGPDALSGAAAPAGGFSPPNVPPSGFTAGPDTSPELPAIHAWRPSAAPPGRSVWTVPGAPSEVTPASEGPTTQIDLRADDAEAQSTARIDLSLVQVAGVRAAEASDDERADPAWLEELSSSEIQPLTVPVGEEGEWNVEAAHAALRDHAEAARVAAEEAEAARIAQAAAREAFALQAAEAERAAKEARHAEALRNADTMSFEAPETRQAREQHVEADAAREAQEAEASRQAEAAQVAEAARLAEAQRAAEAVREAEAQRAAEAAEAQRAAEAAQAAEAQRAAEAAQAQRAADAAQAAEAQRAAEAAEAQRAAEAAEAQGAAEAAQAAEAQRAAEAAQAAEAQRAAEAVEAQRAAEAARAAEAQRAAEAVEAQRAAEAAREAQRAAEAVEAQRAAEAAREAEAQRAAEAAEAQRAAEAAEAQRAAEAVAQEAQRAAEAAQAAEAQRAAEEAEARRAAEAAAHEVEVQRAAEAARLAEAEARRQAERAAQEAEAARFAAAQEALAREAAAEDARQAEEAEALRIAQAAAREAAAMAAASRTAETSSSGGPTERVGVHVLPIDELPRPQAEAAADATIADVTFKSWASEVGPASNIPAPTGAATERIDLPPPILLADPEPVDATPILAVGVATEAALEPALPSQTPEPDYALVHPVPEGPNLRASLPPEEGGTPGLRAPIHLAVREIDDREAVLPFEPPSLGLDPEPTPAPRAAELRVSSKLGSAPLVDEAFARDDQAIQDQSSALSRPRSARTIVERVPSSELVVEPTGRLEPKAQLDHASPGAGGQRIEVASELYRAEAPAPRAKPGDEVITAVEIDRRESPKPAPTQLREEEGTQRIDVHQARLDVNEVIAQSAARVPLEARTELLSSAHPPVPTAHPAPTLSTAVSVGPVAPSVESAREATKEAPKEAPRREVSSAGPVAPSRAPAVDAQDLRRAVGIDIGGRYARLALLELGKVDLLKIEGQAALPAVVALLASGSLVAGADALGEPESNRVSVRALLLAVSGLAVAPVENLSGRWVAKIAGENVELLEILRVFFQPLGAAATRALGTPKVRGILLVPPGASNEAIDLVQRAAKATGLDITEAVPEPLAAGRAYDLDRQPVETALVIDVAATHLGATVLRRGRDGLRPVGGKSWPSPSGADLDHALGALVNEEVKKILGRAAPEDASYLAQLELELERARRDLKKEQAVDLKLKVGDKMISVKLARPRAFQATEPVVSEILGKVREVLSEAGVHPRALGAVVVVGSGGGYGALSQALQSLTGREALTSIDPLTGPFHGLTRPSELIKAPEDRLAPSEGIPFDIGIGLPGGRFRALFPAGTKLPAKQSKKHATTKDAQTDMEFSLYEGRGELLSECRPLGTVSLSGLPRAARGQVSVELELELDLDAVLACTLSEAKSGHKRRVELPTANTPAARKKSLESRPSVEDFGTAPKPKTKVGLLGRLLGKS